MILVLATGGRWFGCVDPKPLSDPKMMPVSLKVRDSATATPLRSAMAEDGDSAPMYNGGGQRLSSGLRWRRTATQLRSVTTVDGGKSFINNHQICNGGGRRLGSGWWRFWVGYNGGDLLISHVEPDWDCLITHHKSIKQCRKYRGEYIFDMFVVSVIPILIQAILLATRSFQA